MVRAVVYTLNRCATQALHLNTPFAFLYNQKPDLNNLWVLGCQDFFLLPKHPNSKFKPEGLSMVLLGYDTHSKTYHSLL